MVSTVYLGFDGEAPGDQVNSLEQIILRRSEDRQWSNRKLQIANRHTIAPPDP